MHVLVTGASGNLGTALLRSLSARRPDWAVTGLCRRPPDASVAPYASASWVSCDLTDPGAAATLTGLMRGADAVVHLAWAIQPSHDEQRMAKVNLEGTRRVLDAARAAGVGQVVHASSVGAYRAAPDKRHVREDWPVEPVPTSLYSRHKVAAEQMLDELEAAGGPVVTRMRPGLVLQGAAGSEIARYFVGSALLTPVLGRLPLVPLPRGLLASAVHADDVGDAVVTMLDARAGGAFNLAADDALTAELLARALGGRLVPVPPALVRRGMDLSWRARLQPTDVGWFDLAMTSPMLDAGRARSELGWRPGRSVDSALRELVRGMSAGAGTASPALQPRGIRDLLPERVRQRV